MQLAHSTEKLQQVDKLLSSPMSNPRSCAKRLIELPAAFCAWRFDIWLDCIAVCHRKARQVLGGLSLSFFRMSWHRRLHFLVLDVKPSAAMTCKVGKLGHTKSIRLCRLRDLGLIEPSSPPFQAFILFRLWIEGPTVLVPAHGMQGP